MIGRKEPIIYLSFKLMTENFENTAEWTHDGGSAHSGVHSEHQVTAFSISSTEDFNF